MQETWAGDLLRDRQVVPRWHTPHRAAELGERSSSTAKRLWPKSATHWLSKLENAGTAGDLFESQFVLGNISVAEFVESHPIRQTQDRQTQARAAVLDKEYKSKERSIIRSLKARLRSEPAQAFLWSELARQYTIVGADDKAKHAMQCALHLAANSIYLRRSAARMYLHFGAKDHALTLLRSFPRASSFPEMVAAEIAVSAAAERPSRFAGIGKRMLEGKQFPARAISELAAAVGTLELENGKHKRARGLFEYSLIDPSENSLAQAQWARGHDSRILIPQSAWETPNSFEANALRARDLLDWDSVIQSASAWLDDEPYSIRPAALGSFACFSPEQNLAAEEIATRALASSPTNLALLNNRAVARAYLGRIGDAFADVSRAVNETDAKDDPHLLATLGLVAYRAGDYALGAECYASSVRWFLDNKSLGSATLASLYWIREFRRHDPEAAAADLAFIKKNLLKITKGTIDPELSSMVNFLDGSSVEDDLHIRTGDGVDSSELAEALERFVIPRSAERRCEGYLDRLI